MKKFTGLVVLIVAMVVLSSALYAEQIPAVVNAFSQLQTEYEFEEKRYSNATLEEKDTFADDAVMVVMKKEASFNKKSFSSSNFSDIKLNGISDATELTGELVEKQATAEKNGNWSELKVRKDQNMLVETDNFRRILRLELKEKGAKNVLDAIKQLEKRDDVLYAGPDYIMEPTANPSPLPTYYNPSNQSLPRQLPLYEKTMIPSAWDITTGSSLVKVGIIDGGIDANHPDLVRRVDQSLCRNFSGNNSPDGVEGGIGDNTGHGTHIAGIIGANRNTGYGAPGVIGINWNVSIVSLRVDRFSSEVVRAISYATNKGIKILNMRCIRDCSLQLLATKIRISI